MKGIASAGSEIVMPPPKPAIIWKPYSRAGTATVFGSVARRANPMTCNIAENRSTKITGILNLPAATDEKAAPNGAANVNGIVRMPACRAEVR